MRPNGWVVAVSLLAMLALTGEAAPASLTEALAQLHTAIDFRDYAGGYVASAGFAQQFPGSAELAAMRVVLMFNAGLEPEAEAAADSMATRFRGSPWVAYAQGFAKMREPALLPRGLTLAESALSAQPVNEEFVLLKASTLCAMGKPRDAETFLLTRLQQRTPTPRLLAMKGSAIIAQVTSNDASPATRAAEAFAAARTLAPIEVSGYALNAGGYPASCVPGSSSFNYGRLSRAFGSGFTYKLLQRARELAPFAVDLRLEYWRWASAREMDARAMGLTDAEIAEVRAAGVAADIAGLLPVASGRPEILDLVARGYERLQQPERQAALQDRILREIPTSLQAEQIQFDRIVARDDSLDALRSFIGAPAHASRAILARAYERLIATDASLTASRLGELARRALALDEHIAASPLIAAALAERGVDLTYAAALAQSGDTLRRAVLETQRGFIVPPAAYATRLGDLDVAMLDILGWIDFQEGRGEAAEGKLNRALEILSLPAVGPKDERQRAIAGILYHLGRVAEAAGRTDAAKEMYLRGAREADAGRVGDLKARSVDALARLHAKETGASLGDIPAYLNALEAELTARRRDRVLAARVATPKSMPAFNLPRLGGGRIVSDALKGKILIVNFWGVWCHGCVTEAPQIQKFYERYKNDSDVAFISIDTLDSLATVTNFVTQRGYTFPIALDDGWVEAGARVGAFPATWFVDRLGRIVYDLDSGSDDVLQESSWITEALKSEPRVGQARVPRRNGEVSRR